MRAGGGIVKAIMASTPAHMVERGKREAIEVVRKAIAHAGAHVDRGHNPAGVPPGQDERPRELRVVSLPGEEGRERRVRCNTFCT